MIRKTRFRETQLVDSAVLTMDVKLVEPEVQLAMQLLRGDKVELTFKLHYTYVAEKPEIMEFGHIEREMNLFLVDKMRELLTKE